MTDITLGGTSHHAIKDQVMALAPKARLHVHPPENLFRAGYFWVALHPGDGTKDDLTGSYEREHKAWEAALAELQARLWQEALGD